MIYENDVFSVDVPEPFVVPADHWTKAFMAQRYTFNGGLRRGAWAVGGTVLNKDGSLHRGGHGEGKPVDASTVPEAIRKQAEAFYNDLADHLQDRYRKVALGAIAVEPIEV